MFPVKTAVIGTGKMGWLYGKIVKQLPEAELIAICGNSSDKTNALANALEVPGYPDKDYESLFNNHPELDAVIIASPDTEHYKSLCSAVAAGVHVCMEKPLTIDVNEAKEMVDLVEKSGLIMMMCHSLRFDPRYVAMHEAVARGDIGKLIHIYARRNIDKSVVERMGGRVNIAYWVGVHDIDMMLWLTKSEVTSVSVRAGSGVLTDEFGVEDCMLSTITFSNGVVAVLENAWATAPVMGRPMSAQFEVRGTGGVIDIAAHEQGIGIYTPDKAIYPDTIYAPDIHGRITGVYRDQLEHFFECVLDKKTPIVTGMDGVRAVAVADAMTRSLEKDCQIKL